MVLVSRASHLAEIERLLKRYRVVALLGARQVGKSTLARQIAERFRGASEYVDLEEQASLRALESPESFLASKTGLVVLDEVQRRPELFPVLRVLADRPGGPRFLVLGSASPELLKQSSKRSPAALRSTICHRSICRKWGPTVSNDSGSGGASPGRSPLTPTRRVVSGGATSSRRFSSETCHNWASASLPRRSAVSGRSSRMSMVRR